MDSTVIIALLYVAGVALLIAEVFVPSHGLLTIGSLVCLGFAVYQTFLHTTTGGAIGLIASVLLVPTVLLLGIKNVHRLPMGKYLAPPNPEARVGRESGRMGDPVDFVGAVGRSLTPLRPVGIVEFNGQRVPCVAESGIIDAGQSVIGIEVHMSNLAVRPHAGNA
ncbi:MAG: serine protease [Phycisphaerales bacterium]|nr:serine protease [Phycisphaerales bacterium]